jgi:hypothetical protein
MRERKRPAEMEGRPSVVRERDRHRSKDRHRHRRRSPTMVIIGYNGYNIDYN